MVKILLVSDHMLFPNGYTRRRDQWIRLLTGAGHEVRCWRPGPGGNGTPLPEYIASRLVHGNEGIVGLPDRELWRLMKWADVIHLMAGGPATMFAMCTGWLIHGKRVVTSVHVSKDMTDRLNFLLRGAIQYILHPLLRYLPHCILFPTDHNRVSWGIPEGKGLVFGTPPYMLELPEPTQDEITAMRRLFLSLPSRGGVAVAGAVRRSGGGGGGGNGAEAAATAASGGSGSRQRRGGGGNKKGGAGGGKSTPSPSPSPSRSSRRRSRSPQQQQQQQQQQGGGGGDDVDGELELDLSTPIIAYIGRLVWDEKRLDRIVRLAEALGDRARFVVVGSGPDKEKFAAAAPSVGLAGSMAYEQMRIVYGAVDATISPGDVESFGMVPIESLLCGRAGYVQDNHRFRQTYGVAGDELFINLDTNVAADAERILQQAKTHRANIPRSASHWLSLSKRITCSEADVVKTLHRAYGLE